MFDQDVADFLLHSRRCEIKGLEYLLTTSQMIGQVRALVHCLQRERGATNLFLGSQGSGDAERMASYRGEVDEAMAEVCGLFVGAKEHLRCPAAASRFFAQAALALHGLGTLPRLREEIDRFRITMPEATERFNALMSHLLAVVFEAADTVSDPAISSALVALLNFMQGKELAGQERALGVAGFNQGWRDQTLRGALLHRIEAQDRCFQVFAKFADAATLRRWEELMAAPLTAEFERLRRMAFTRVLEGDAGLEWAQIWFDQATRRLDAMKAIEDALERVLREVCEARLAEARAGLLDDEVRLAALGREGGSPQPVGVILGDPVNVPSDEWLELARQGLMGGGVGRSLLDLVQRQARRLQHLEGELQAARQALDERKLIEQAKALLIQHRGMTEDEAHRVLRKAAMDQGKRLVEVARAAIAMAEVLGPRF